MKTDRLVAILVMLLRKERVQAKELAEKFDVSVRTILRDVESINLAGIPVVTYQGAGGGIGLAQGYRLDKSVLTDGEMAAVITALKGVDGTITGTSHDILIEKLKNTLTGPQLAALDTKLKQFVIDLNPWSEDSKTKENLSVLRGAIENTRLVEFSYLDSEGRETRRSAEPYSLILKSHNWYLYAWCVLRKDFRYFRVSRIRELAVTSVYFQPREAHPEVIPAGYEQRTQNLVQLELLFSPLMENIISEWFGNDAQKQADGFIRVTTAMPENYRLYSFILSFGAEIEVLSPPQIRNAIFEIAKKIHSKYSN